MAGKLYARSVSRATLSGDEVRDMFNLFDEHYLGATRELFRRDLDAKGWVIILRDVETDRLQGFTTLVLAEAVVQSGPVGVVYSGDTIIRPEFWGTPELPRAWLSTVLALAPRVASPLYWLLVTSGYKTYRTLPVLAQEFYPRFDRPTPPSVQALIDSLATERFGADYDSGRTIVRFSRGATPLRAGVADVSPERLRDPHVAFFLARNPGYARGDELVCLAHFHPDNFSAAARRLLR